MSAKTILQADSARVPILKMDDAPNMLEMSRQEELALLEKLRAEALLPERYPQQ